MRALISNINSISPRRRDGKDSVIMVTIIATWVDTGSQVLYVPAYHPRADAWLIMTDVFSSDAAGGSSRRPTTDDRDDPPQVLYLLALISQSMLRETI
jgi:hypothetical protein